VLKLIEIINSFTYLNDTSTAPAGIISTAASVAFSSLCFIRVFLVNNAAHFWPFQCVQMVSPNISCAGHLSLDQRRRPE
jgi:hypothetical protein